MSQIERYGFHTIHDLDVPPVFSQKSDGEYILYEAHRKREEELLGMLQLLVDAIELIPGGSVMKRITNEARALLDAAKEEKHGTE